MIKYILIFITFWISMVCRAQNVIPNAGFESWVDIDTFPTQKPEGWRPDSTLSYLRAGLPAPIFQSSDAFDGDFSLGFKNIYQNGVLKSDSIRFTFNFKGRPGSLMGYYKNTGAGSLSVRIALMARDANSQFFVLSNDSILLTDTNGWRPFILPIHYSSSDLSSRAEIRLHAIGTDTMNYSLIDRLSFSTYNLINFLAEQQEEEFISYEILLLDGRLYMKGPSRFDKTISGLNPGIYIIRQTTKTGTYCYKFIQNTP